MPKRYFPLSKEDEELDELACRIFNPDDMIDVVLPSGAIARVSRTVSQETLDALDRLAVAAINQYSYVPLPPAKPEGELLSPPNIDKPRRFDSNAEIHSITKS